MRIAYVLTCVFSVAACLFMPGLVLHVLDTVPGAFGLSSMVLGLGSLIILAGNFRPGGNQGACLLSLPVLMIAVAVTAISFGAPAHTPSPGVRILVAVLLGLNALYLGLEARSGFQKPLRP